MRWTALEPGRMFQALLELNRATGWDDFRDALRDWTVPSQNFVYADVEGNIGYQMPSHVPQRRAGDGSRPVPGWVDDYQWGEYLPFEALPYTLNPSLGYVVTANQPVLPAAEADRFVGAGFDEGFRAERITQLIEADPALSLDDLIAIQGDDYNPSAEDLVPLLTALALDEPKLAAAQEALRGWDYQMRLDSQPAAVYIAIFNALLTDVFRPGVPEEFWSRGSAPAFATLRTILAEPTSPWWGPDGRDVGAGWPRRRPDARLPNRVRRSRAAPWLKRRGLALRRVAYIDVRRSDCRELGHRADRGAVQSRAVPDLGLGRDRQRDIASTRHRPTSAAMGAARTRARTPTR